MKTKVLVSSFSAIAITLLGCLRVHADYDIIDDTFSAEDGTLASAHTPEADLPGGSYQVSRTNDGDSNAAFPTIEGDELQLTGSSAAALSLSSNPGTGYTKPTTFTISANIEEGNIGQSSGFVRGIGLGFYTDAPSGAADGVNEAGGFAGVILNATDGSLDLFYPGSDTPESNKPIIAYNAGLLGAFSETTVYSLSYTVDTATGLISGVTLSDSLGTETGSFTTTEDGGGTLSSIAFFTDAQTSYASITAATDGAEYHSYADNFVVEAPEPSTYALLLGGIALLLGLRRVVRAS